MSDNTLVHSVTEYGIFTGRWNSVLGRNTLLCCSHFGWNFSDFVFGNIDINNTTLSRHRGLISDIDWHAVHVCCLTDVINVRGVASLEFSDGSICHRTT